MKDVFIVYSCSVVFILFFGSAIDALQHRENVIRYVPCSVDLIDRAAKFNVTLLSECEVVE